MSQANVEKIKAMKLSQLGFCSNTLNQAVYGMLAETNREKDAYDPSRRKRKKLCREWAERITVKDLIELFDRLYENVYNDNGLKRHHDLYRGRLGDLYKEGLGKHLRKKLVELGLTRIDCRFLPQSTMAKVRLTKEEWFDTPIDLLGTMPRRVLRSGNNLAYRSHDNHDVTRKPLYSITVRDVVSGSNYLAYGTRADVRTCRKLKELGFNEKDGPFMKRYLTQDREEFSRLKKSLIADDRLTAKEAEKVIAIAMKRSWID